MYIERTRLKELTHVIMEVGSPYSVGWAGRLDAQMGFKCEGCQAGESPLAHGRSSLLFYVGL